VGTRKDGSSMKIMAGSTTPDGMRGVVEAHLHAGFIAIGSPSTAPRP
jgi:hypothetical protein